MECRVGCGACCIAISISSPIPGMPDGKPAGLRCVNLLSDHRCSLYGRPEYPGVCANFKADPEVCGKSFADAMRRLELLETATSPESST
ncbi:MAG: YkgJ family cysteine cluster protein [Candidatus Marinimicrobia bacterium]|nr:YkgJ family cysteine cluster protein [Candidatus Neomarinimicrobiota bacterium]